MMKKIIYIVIAALLAAPQLAHAHGEPIQIIGLYVFLLLHIFFFGYLLLSDSFRGIRSFALLTFTPVDCLAWYLMDKTQGPPGWFHFIILSLPLAVGFVFYRKVQKKRLKE